MEKNQHKNTETADKKSLPVDDELVIAKKTLQNMIPQPLPNIEGIDIGVIYRPCKKIEGDLLDIIPISEDLVAFVVFKVIGHGVSSALIAAMGKVAFANHIRQNTSPRSVIERVNKEMNRYLSKDCFSNIFVAYLNLHDNQLTYCNVGDSCQFLYEKKSGKLQKLLSSGEIKITEEATTYGEHNIYLNPDDWLFIQTEGIYSLFGEPEESNSEITYTTAISTRCSDFTCSKMVDYLEEKHAHISAKKKDNRDIALIAINILTQSKRHFIKQQLDFDTEAPVYLKTINYFEEMDDVIATILKHMDNLGYADDTIRKMKITLTELIVNALEHGNKKDFSKKVTIGHIVDNNQTKISIMDEGSGFNPEDVPDPTLPENLIKDSGRGLFIVRCYVNEITFNKQGNRITIVKYFG